MSGASSLRLLSSSDQGDGLGFSADDSRRSNSEDISNENEITSELPAAKHSSTLNQGDCDIEVVLASLRQEFHEQYGKQADPATALGIIKNLHHINDADFWNCFCLVYPNIAVNLIPLRGGLQNLGNLLYRRNKSTIVLLFEGSFARYWSWPFQYMRIDDEKFSRWIKERVEIQELLAGITMSLELVKPRLEDVKADIGMQIFDELPQRLGDLVAYLEGKVQEAGETAAEIEAEKIKQEQDERLNLPSTLFKPRSWTSGSNTPLQSTTMRNRGVKGNAYDYGYGTRYTSDRALKPKIHRRFAKAMREHKARLCTVILFAIASVVTTGFSAWKCTQPEQVPIIDSNFWSTLSSAFTGTAGLYCTIIPKLQSQEIKLGSPFIKKVFYLLLVLSLLTVIAASICYAYHPRSSLILLSISSLAQLATTLMLIEGAVTKIIKDERDLMENAKEIRGLKRSLGRG